MKRVPFRRDEFHKPLKNNYLRMKPAKLFILGVLFLPLNLVLCEAGETVKEELNVEEKTILDMDEMLKTVAFASDSTVLSQNEITGLYLMREEEKMAHDVYAFFYAKFNVRTFGNISKSENRHKTAVLRLINYFGLTDPSNQTTGVFTNQEMQKLYNKFTTEAITAIDALKIGAFIEEYDIADLRKLIDETQNADIKFVYGNLLRGSTFHLRAFTGVLKVRGVTYIPTILSQEDYNALIAK